MAEPTGTQALALDQVHRACFDPGRYVECRDEHRETIDGWQARAVIAALAAANLVVVEKGELEVRDERVLDLEAQLRETKDRAASKLDILIESVVRAASIVPGGTSFPYVTSSQHVTWAIWGEWRAGAQTPDGAKSALRSVIRYALEGGGEHGA